MSEGVAGQPRPGTDSSSVAGPADRHVVLVGLPGAGKSTAGPIIAGILGRPYHDLDEEIARREGLSIAEIFASRGEAGFREIEVCLTRELLAGPPAVVSAGGGWIVSESNLTAARGLAVTVHLRVSPETAASRMGLDAEHRPLLGGTDPTARLQALWAARRERYVRADVEVDTEALDTEAVAAAVVRLIGRSAG